MQDVTTDRRGTSPPPQCTTSLTHLSTTPRWSDSNLNTPWRQDAEQLHRHTGPATGIMVLEPVVLPYLQGLATVIFQQDNARPYVARIVQRSFVNHQIELLPWTARSPDL
ncbi:hypothetical protein TNCV_704631 [Trichonephila clavipes]|nr:hypothetical protein TNCV_704631 [Trichonephila clavipes]